MNKHIERAAFEAWMREECGADDVSLQICEGGHYGWGRTCDMWAAWERARASQAPAPSPAASIDTDAFQNLLDAAYSSAIDKAVCGSDHGTLKRLRDDEDKLIAHIDAHCARLASQSASAKDAADGITDAERMSHIEGDHVMGASYGGIVAINVHVRGDDYAMGGLRYALDCQIEGKPARAAMTRAER